MSGAVQAPPLPTVQLPRTTATIPIVRTSDQQPQARYCAPSSTLRSATLIRDEHLLAPCCFVKPYACSFYCED
ncbi:hypothetical protein V6N13_075566 [Hibiscus sabdariffa]